MDEKDILAWTFAVITTIAIIVIAFQVTAIRRMLESRQERSDATDRPSTPP